MLHDRLASLLDETAMQLELRPVSCLASCDHGCAAAITMPGRWSFLLGRLNAELAPDLLTYAATYAASATGTVMPSRRPPSLRTAILGRIPAQEPAA
jgi:predicted metal-binding protein